jgi:hypothetical protein
VNSAAAAAAAQKPTSYIPLDISDIEGILSRLRENLSPTKSATGSGGGAAPKQ